MNDPILQPSPNRLILLPIRYPKIWEMYKRAQRTFWTTEEVDLSNDRQDWERLHDNERKFIGNILAFFASADGIVNENLVERFCAEVQIPEARSFYGFQIMIENVHAETYALLIDSFITDPGEKHYMLTAAESMPVISAKAQWALKWIKNESSFGVRLVAFAAIEGIFFSASFAGLFWLKKRGLMPGTTFANELIARDEGLHTEFACILFGHLMEKPSYGVVCEVIKEAVVMEEEFVKDSLHLGVIGISDSSMCQYVRYVADHLLVMLDMPKMYGESNPFDFMDLISLEGKTNFFERRVSEYSKAQLFTAENRGDNYAELFEHDF